MSSASLATVRLAISVAQAQFTRQDGRAPRSLVIHEGPDIPGIRDLITFLGCSTTSARSYSCYLCRCTGVPLVLSLPLCTVEVRFGFQSPASVAPSTSPTVLMSLAVQRHYSGAMPVREEFYRKCALSARGPWCRCGNVSRRLIHSHSWRRLVGVGTVTRVWCGKQLQDAAWRQEFHNGVNGLSVYLLVFVYYSLLFSAYPLLD